MRKEEQGGSSFSLIEYIICLLWHNFFSLSIANRGNLPNLPNGCKVDGARMRNERQGGSGYEEERATMREEQRGKCKIKKIENRIKNKKVT